MCAVGVSAAWTVGLMAMTGHTLNALRDRFSRLLIGFLWACCVGISAIAIARGVWPVLIPVMALSLVSAATVLWLRERTGTPTRYVSSVAVAGMIATDGRSVK